MLTWTATLPREEGRRPLNIQDFCFRQELYQPQHLRGGTLRAPPSVGKVGIRVHRGADHDMSTVSQRSAKHIHPVNIPWQGMRVDSRHNDRTQFSAVYDLSAGVAHAGGDGGGHYWAAVKYEDKS